MKSNTTWWQFLGSSTWNHWDSVLDHYQDDNKIDVLHIVLDTCLGDVEDITTALDELITTL